MEAPKAPEKCKNNCPLGRLVFTECSACVNLDGERAKTWNHPDTISPGPSCPFVLLAAVRKEVDEQNIIISENDILVAAKDAEIERLLHNGRILLRLALQPHDISGVSMWNQAALPFRAALKGGGE